MKAKIILVEDDVLLRESLIDALTLAGFQITGVGTGAEYRQQLAADQFSVAIIDVGLPDCNGFELAEETQQKTTTKIIFLTARETLSDRVRGYRSGGLLYFTKPVDTRELSAAIESICKVDLIRNDDVSQRDRCWSLDLSNWSLTSPAKKNIRLTANELHFLQLLAESNGQVVPRTVLLEKLYPRIDNYTSRALDALVRRLRKKVRSIQAGESPIQTSYAQGFTFSEVLQIKKQHK